MSKKILERHCSSPDCTGWTINFPQGSVKVRNIDLHQLLVEYRELNKAKK